MRVLILCHADLVPPAKYLELSKNIIDNKPWRTEGYVARALVELGHEVGFCGVDETVAALNRALESFQPDVVFNLLEEFSGEALFEPMLISYLKWRGVKVTGGSPEELMITKNKIATKAILRAYKLPTPGDSKWPRVVKYVFEESSRGITDKAIVKNQSELLQAKKVLKRKLNTPVFSENYIEGRELHCGVIRRDGKLVLSKILETRFGQKRGPKILTEKLKWDFAYRKKLGIEFGPATSLSSSEEKKISKTIRIAAEALKLSGPARIDIRYSVDKLPYIIEVNSNPDLAEGDEFAQSFAFSGVSYSELVSTIVSVAN